jgi:hypothetical protein
VKQDVFKARELYEKAELGSSARARASAKTALGAMQVWLVSFIYICVCVSVYVTHTK